MSLEEHRRTAATVPHAARADGRCRPGRHPGEGEVQQDAPAQRSEAGRQAGSGRVEHPGIVRDAYDGPGRWRRLRHRRRGLFTKEALVGERGAPMSALAARQMVCAALQDKRFSGQPEVRNNCVRIYYASPNNYHVDVPVYRRTRVVDPLTGVATYTYELASADWKASDALRACLKLSRLEHALEAHAGHEQRGEHGHVPRGLVAHLVVDAQAAVALQATERLLDLPAPRLDDEAPAANRADEFPDDAVAGEELAAALGGEAEAHPGQAQRGVGGRGPARGRRARPGPARRPAPPARRAGRPRRRPSAPACGP